MKTFRMQLVWWFAALLRVPIKVRESFWAPYGCSDGITQVSP